MSEKLKAAVILGAHGVRGQIRLHCLLEDHTLLCHPELTDATGTSFSLQNLKWQGKSLVAGSPAAATREAAEALKGTELWLPRAALPPARENEWYAQDLIGCRAVDPLGASIGTVTAIENFGAGDLLELALPDGESTLIPFKSAFVLKIDTARREIVLQPPEMV